VSGHGRKLGSIAGGGLVPLLDTLFIIIFALLALSDVRRTEREELVRIRLPEVEAGDEPGAPRASIALEVGPDSSVHFSGSEVTIDSWEELDEGLALALGESLPEEVTVELRADREARYGVAVELLQHLRLRGFADVQLIATGAPAPEGTFGGGGR
jgi:biopolymer transport protein ExbD